MNLETATPAQIDEKLAEIYGRYYTARDAADAIQARIVRDINRNTAAARGDRFAYLTPQTEIDADTARHAAAMNAADLVLAEAVPFNAEFTRRGGWTRAYLVSNNGGHVHSTMACQTCFVTTRFGWLTQMSDHSEAEIVELAGEGACSVCYPSAPRVGRNRLELPEVAAEVAAAKAERAAAKTARDAAKAAKAITAADGSGLRDSHGWRVETVAAAWMALVGNVADHRAYGYSLHAGVNADLVAALVAKLGQTEAEVLATMEAKVAAKIKRDRAA